MRPALLALIILLIAMAAFFWSRSVEAPLSNVLTIRNVRIPVEVRADNQGRQQGLSGRTVLPKGQGMLFLFAREDRYTFWMKDMQFGLDFVWIRKGRVVATHENVPPPPPLQTIAPPEPVDAVLELRAGFISEHTIQIGDSVDMALDASVKIE